MPRSRFQRRRGSSKRRQTVSNMRSQGRKEVPSCTSQASTELFADVIYVQTGSPEPAQQSQNYGLVEEQGSEGRLIRVRVNMEHQTIYSADDAMGTSNTYPDKFDHICFHGPLSGFKPEIFMSMQRGLIYFDEPIKVAPPKSRVRSVNGDPSPITRIAINIDRVPLTEIEILRLSFNEEDLSSLILVMSCDKAYTEKHSEVDSWGFKHVTEGWISTMDLRRYERGLRAYERGLRAVAVFNDGRVRKVKPVFALEGGAQDK